MRFLRLWMPEISAVMICIAFLAADGRTAHACGEGRHWLLPDVVSMQTAGYIGYVAGGIGYLSFDRLWESTLFYGYVPREVGGIEIHTVSWKNTFYFVHFMFADVCEITPLYLGLTILFAMDRNVHWQYSTDCPQWYYPPTGAHAAVNVGVQLLVRSELLDLTYGFYAELSMLDTYLKAYVWDDNDHLALNDCATLAIGYKILF